MIQKGRNRKSQVSDILNPTDGYRGSIAKKGQKPKNHMSMNAKKIKDAQNEFKMKEQIEAEKKREKLFKMKKFSHVKSKLTSTTRPQTCKSVRPDMQNLVDNDQDKENFNQNNQASTTTDFGVNNGDFIKRNIHTAMSTSKAPPATPPQSKPEFGGSAYRSKGKVPKYLTKYKEEWKQSELEREIEAEKQRIPPGTKLLPEDERLATLDQLNETRATLINTIESLPISMRTMSLRNKKFDLEAKLKEVDAAIKLFSKENVYVAI
jgi:hypothetical protein